MKTIPLLLLAFLLTLASATVAGAAKFDSENSDTPEKDFPFERRVIFFAVLEGLCETGVNSEDLKFILPNPDTMVDPEHPDQVNFVYACPICHPTFDALRTYHGRQKFYGQKGTIYNTFGAGLDAKTQQDLRADPETCRLAIRMLIDGWVHA